MGGPDGNNTQKKRRSYAEQAENGQRAGLLRECKWQATRDLRGAAPNAKAGLSWKPGPCLCHFLPQEIATLIRYQSGLPLGSRKLYVSRPMATDLAMRAGLPSNMIREPTTVTLSSLWILISYCFMNEAGARWISMVPVSVFTVMWEPIVPLTGH